MSEHALNKSQQEAVEYIDGPLLIIAGAGTGKTTVITKKIAHLIDEGYAKPEEILALTFTDNAADEMLHRVESMLESSYIDLHISTFHSFCQKILESYAMDIGLSNTFSQLTETDAWLLLRNNIYSFDIDYYRPLGNPTRHVHELLSYFSKCKDNLITPEDHASFVENNIADSEEEVDRMKELANLYKQYNQLLRDKGAMDFGDLILNTFTLLSTKPHIKKQIASQYKYILVDEFQDVNKAQYDLVKLISEQSQLTIVGDDDQAIYAFRGASVANIMAFTDDFPKAKKIVLTENYRSHQSILDLAYTSIAHNNPDRLEVKLDINKKLIASGNTDEGSIVHLHASTVDDEVESVIKTIGELKKQKNCSWDDIAILARANNHLEPFVNALEKANIPYEYLAASGLYRQPIVIDAMNIFRIIHDKYESAAVFRLLKLPIWSFSENDMQKLTAGARKKSISYYEALKRAQEFYLSDPGIAICKQLIDIIHDGMKNSRHEKPTSLLVSFMETSGYFSYLTREESKGNTNIIRQIRYLRQFFDMIARYEELTQDATIAGFVEHIDAILRSGDNGQLYQPTDTPESVNLMTIHGSKGLEYPYVFIVNMIDGRFPGRRKGGDIPLPEELVASDNPEHHYQEERRLFYVAMTRAKERLYFTSANYYGGVRKAKLSRFLDELGYVADDTKEVNTSSVAALLPSSSTTITSDGTFSYDTPKAFSFSQIKAYQTCPYQYKLAHVLKIPMRGNASFSFGSSIHNTLQAFYERVQELNSASQSSLFDKPTNTAMSDSIEVPELSELMEMYDSAWIDSWYQNSKQREQYFEKGKEVLETFYTTHEGNWNVPVSLEGGFVIMIGDHKLRGRIDRIDQLDDDTLEIIDYKTGKGKEKLTSDDKEQLLIYQIAAQTLPQYRNIGEVSKLTFYYVNENMQTSFMGKDKDLQRLEKKVSEAAEGIISGDFTPKPSKFSCTYCDYKNICDFRQ